MTTTLVVCALMLPGCKSDETSNPEEKVTEVKLALRAEKNSNNGRPMHVIVREVTRKSFVEDDYSAVARLVVHPNETVTTTLVIFPGQDCDVILTFKKPPEAIGVYGLFTVGKGESWKTLAERAEEVFVSLGESAVGRVNVRQRAASASQSQKPSPNANVWKCAEHKP